LSAPTWALTVPQPAAWAITHRHQDVYNRPFSTDVRGWIAISAGSAVDAELMHITSQLTGWTPEAINAASPERSMIVAVARLVDVCDDQPCDCSPWANKRFIHWRIADAIPLAEPVPAPHNVGIWKMPDELATRVAHQWQAAQDAARAAERPISNGHKDFASLRDQLLPLPGASAGYRHVLLLGTTGAGKTTVIRQLLGTDPDTERFPSTSPAKTTVADTELILTGERRFRAAVTFADRDEIADHLRDNVWEAAKAVFEGRPDVIVQDKLLDHVSQRFRFSYLLGRAAPLVAVEDDLDTLDDDEPLEADFVDDRAPAQGNSDPRTVAMIQQVVEAIHHVVRTQLMAVQAEITADGDERTIEEIIEDELENRVRRSPVAAQIVKALLNAIEERFDLLTDGRLHRDANGWPESWTWETGDRSEFLRVITRFSSNQAVFFGTLLTPLVNGIRVSGPFRPLWMDSDARLVLIDGEGMGHVQDSATEVSTRVRKRLDDVDAIVLVDNAAQPMQAAPVAVMRTAAATGNGEKLHFLFTHLDLVKGDNIRTTGDQKRHVLQSAENILNAVREDLGVAERVLRRRLDEARYFVGDIQRPLDPRRLDPARHKAHLRTVSEFSKLVDALTAEAIEMEVGPARPVYKSERLTQTVVEAAEIFHQLWDGMLGLSYDPEVKKQHWATVKALTRRLSEGRVDEYRDLRPAASLRTGLENALYLMIQNPMRWSGPEPDAEEQQIIFDNISRAVTKRLVRVVDRLITEDPRADWLRAYEEQGSGSTFRRAQILAEDIYTRAVPRPGLDADDSSFVREVRGAFEEVAADHFLLD
jgi:energy-coupling factor transporter ATP-binding protein EcfA2